MRGWVMLPVLLLGACGDRGAVEVENATVAEVANQVRAADGAGSERFQPGLWEATLKMEEVSAPGVPPQMVDQMRKAMSDQRSTTCLTAADAEKPAADFFTGRQMDQCRYDHFRMGGGKLDARLTCVERGATQVMVMEGSYAPTSYRMRLTAENNMKSAGAPGSMRMVMQVDARRTGECTGKEKA